MQALAATSSKAWRPGIRLRAERRAGELLRGMKETGTRHAGHGDQKSESRDTTPKLSDLGVTYDQSSKGRSDDR